MGNISVITLFIINLIESEKEIKKINNNVKF